MATTKVTPAAGGVVWRKASSSKDGVEVLLVHRPRYDDWTYPKGKAEAGELPPVTASREIHEETGLTVRLGRPLPAVTYRVRGGVKEVSYWLARPRGESEFTPSKEIDKTAWLGLRAARKRLTYDHDIALLDQLEDLVAAGTHRTRTLVLLRHATAEPREEFDGPDDLARPLSTRGLREAELIVPTLAAFGIRRVVSSPALRCRQTVEPFATAHRRDVHLDEDLTEDARPKAVRDVVRDALEHKAVLLCSHRPTFPDLFASLDLDDPGLDPGEAAVVHHRKGKVLALERW
ncbi:NUDIX hydrolase [Aeromicrobium phragmitis]|uniref:NUDIX hydrolase n=1 Tax=Aeromicrobium phragmitis TaxID=2478914 RepID=A0A3L8PJF8_9ACTN|nr:NUDIX domain-containing protein [Aeromicrobium phragmitis]RLV54899.1 NUDIX hydrolase [Aeromicrobium phragmitis]